MARTTINVALLGLTHLDKETAEILSKSEIPERLNLVFETVAIRAASPLIADTNLTWESITPHFSSAAIRKWVVSLKIDKDPAVLIRLLRLLDDTPFVMRFGGLGSGTAVHLI